MAVSTVQAIVNGTTYTLTYNSQTKAYETTITAPSKSSYNQTGHYYPITITAYDESGNHATIDSSDATFGNALKLVVKEKVAPTLTITYPTSNSTLISNRPTISWNASDSDSGIASITANIDGETSKLSNVTSSGAILTEALSDGSHTLSVTVTDNDGNSTTKTSSFKIDTVPPTLTVSSPNNNFKTNIVNCVVSGTTNDLTSSPVTLTVNGNNVDVNASGNFSTSITLVEGANEITIIATDGAGKSTTVTRTVYLDTKVPEFQNVTITPNPVDAGKTFVISVKVIDD